MSSKLFSEKQQHGETLFCIDLPMYKENLVKIGPMSLKCQPLNAREHHIAISRVSVLSSDHSSTLYTYRGVGDQEGLLEMKLSACIWYSECSLGSHSGIH